MTDDPPQILVWRSKFVPTEEAICQTVVEAQLSMGLMESIRKVSTEGLVVFHAYLSSEEYLELKPIAVSYTHLTLPTKA